MLGGAETQTGGGGGGVGEPGGGVGSGAPLHAQHEAFLAALTSPDPC